MHLWTTDNLDFHTPAPTPADETTLAEERRPRPSSRNGGAPDAWMTRPCEDALCSGGNVGQFRDEEAFSGLTLDGFTAPIIALGGGHIGMTRQALHGGDIGAGIQQVADVGPAQVVWTEAFHYLLIKH